MSEIQFDPALVAKTAELQARKLELEVEKLEAEVERTQVLTWGAVMEREEIESSDWYNGVFYFVGDVTDESVVELMREMSAFRRYAPRKSTTLYLNTDGGRTTASLHLYEFLREVPRLTIHVRGWAASAGAVILQAATRRRMDREAHLMLHKVNMDLPRVDADTLITEAESIKVWSEQTLRIMSSRSKVSVEEMDERTKHRDWYLTAQEALELGFVDELV